MSKTTFVSSTPISSAFLNAINNIVFDGLEADGHLPPIADSDLSSEPDSVKSRLNEYLNNFKPEPSSGLTLTIRSGSYLAPNGSIYSQAQTQITLPNNQSGYVYFDATGTLLYANALPEASHLAIAKVTTSNAVLTDLIDIRDRAMGLAQGLLWPDYSNTSIVQSDYSPVSRQRVLANAISGSFTLTLPASPLDGSRIQILDVANSFATNPVTVARNGKKIRGLVADLVLNIANSATELVYSSALGDWRLLSVSGNSELSGGSAYLTNTTIKSSDYDALAFELVLCNSTAAGFTVTLPATPVDGTIIGIADVADSFTSSPIVIDGNGATIANDGSQWTIDSDSVYLELFYVQALNDWRFKEVKGVRAITGNSVELTGAQSISGHKTFLGEVSVPDPISPSSAINKAYLDNAIAVGIISKDIALTNSSVKTSAYTAKPFERVLCDSTSAPFSVTLPSNPANSTIVAISDISGQFSARPVTVVRNGKLIEGMSQNLVLSQAKAYVELIYVTDLNSWVIKRDFDGQSATERAKWLVIDSAFNASVGDRLAIDTTTGPVLLTLPQSPTVGDSLELSRLSDFSANSLTLTKASSITIEGSTSNYVLSSNAFSRMLLLWNGTTWRLVQS